MFYVSVNTLDEHFTESLEAQASNISLQSSGSIDPYEQIGGETPLAADHGFTHTVPAE